MAIVNRIYVQGLTKIFKAAHKYGTRYQQQLSVHLTEPQYTCLLSSLQAIADCLAALAA
jgi:hypothetical protein